MLPDLQLAVRLQELDNRVTELTREISALPKHIAEIEKKLESHTRKLEADRAALNANQTDRKKNEGDIQLQEQKISKLRGQMLDAKTNEQYRAFQNEIEFCEKEIRRAEDHILDLMGESEPLDKNVKAAELALKEEKAQVEAEKQQAMARTAEDKKALDQIHQERAQIVARLHPNVYRSEEHTSELQSLSLHDALPIWWKRKSSRPWRARRRTRRLWTRSTRNARRSSPACIPTFTASTNAFAKAAAA